LTRERTGGLEGGDGRESFFFNLKHSRKTCFANRKQAFVRYSGEKHPFSLVMTRLGFTLSLPAGASIANGSSAPISAEGLTKIDADITIALRLQNPDGTISPVPNEAVLAKLKTKYIPYSLPPLEPSSGPVTDLVRAETVLRSLR
jgi:iron complex transport system substrate-binding protein